MKVPHLGENRGKSTLPSLVLEDCLRFIVLQVGEQNWREFVSVGGQQFEQAQDIYLSRGQD